MKKTIVLGFLALFLVGIVSAADPTGFNLQKHVDVSGDWEWVGANPGGSWQITNPSTATFDLAYSSPLATMATYVENENLGIAWEYDLQSVMTSNAPTTTQTMLNAWTVNDPMTTPATGGYTEYQFYQQTTGQFSTSALSVNGFGAAVIHSVVGIQSPATQYIGIAINP